MGRRLQGSIVRKKQLWYGVADLGRDARGMRCRKWTRGFEKRRDAERDLARLISTAAPTLPAQITVAALVKDYVDHAEALGRQKTTVARYRSLLRSNIEPAIGATRISGIRGSLLNDFYSTLRSNGLSDTTVAHVHGLLTATFRWGRRCGRTDRDPMIAVDPPRRSRSTARAMRPEDARAFFSWLPTTVWARWHPLFLFALATGMRRGELLALRRENVDVARGVVIVAESLAETKGSVYRKVTKTESIREIPISALAAQALDLAERVRTLDRDRADEAYEEHDLVFAGPAGCRIRPMTVTDAFRRAADAFGKPDCTLHTLRHTAATWLLTGGADLRTTSSILGHSDAATTLRVYSHVVNERQRTAVTLIGDLLAGIVNSRDLIKPIRSTERAD